ncbi:hypothetical protein [Sulfobacillus thermosulfidooxidans]|uniref:hypothetical protein n=1 Tax=Sulfobacillus thermosulfidooxidans TaxID=28034 RepID=UPI0006B5A242|nr:hypothetical protein [Sulfobacillus thermosulfidooxidans]
MGRPRATSSPSWSVMTLSEVTGLPVSVIWSDLQNGILSGTMIQGKTIIRLEDLMASKRDSYRLVAENLGNTSRKEPKDEDDGPTLTVRPPLSTSWKAAHSALYRGETIKVSLYDVLRQDRLLSHITAPSLSPGVIALSGFAGQKGTRPVYVIGPQARLDQELISLRLLPQIVSAYPVALQAGKRILWQLQESPQYFSDVLAQLILDYGTKMMAARVDEAWHYYKNPRAARKSHWVYRQDGTLRTVGGIFFALIKSEGYWHPEKGSGSSGAVFRGEVLPISPKIVRWENRAKVEARATKDIETDIAIDQIYIPKAFEMHPPRAAKIEKARNMSEQAAPLLVKQWDLDSEGRPAYVLLDGYIRYLVAKEKQSKTVSVRII